ncbi:exonuclease [Vibrio phage F99]
MSKKRLSDEKIVAILEGIFKDNKPNTQVALEVLGKKTKESSVRHIKRTYEKHGNYFGITVETAEVEDQDWKIPEDTLEVLCEHPDWNLSNLAKRLRTAQRTNNQLRKIQRETFDSEGDVEYDFASVMQDVVKGLVDVKYEVPTASKEPRNPRTVEVIFSDLQIAKVTENYNTEVAIRALEYYGKEVLKKVQQVNPERIVFAALGDNCEGNDKHGIQSAISTDTGNAEQLTNCIREVWKKVLLPLFSLGIPVDFHGVQGNHLSSTIKGMGNFYEGRYGWDYAIYSAWELLAETMGFAHVTFTMPEGIFGTYDIYGKTTVYEHGYELKGQGEGAMQKLKEKRMNNTKKWIDRIVIGDRHHSEIYGCGDYVLNGAFFGIGRQGVEYSGNLGFNSNPMQTILVHEPTDLPNVSTVVGIHCVQIVKGYGLTDNIKGD